MSPGGQAATLTAAGWAESGIVPPERSTGWSGQLRQTKPRIDERWRSGSMMSGSSLYHHFAGFTAASPWEYQKWLRLERSAAPSMPSEGADAATAAGGAGYEKSPRQFEPREYWHDLFGAPATAAISRECAISVHAAQLSTGFAGAVFSTAIRTSRQ